MNSAKTWLAMAAWLLLAACQTVDGGFGPGDNNSGTASDTGTSDDTGSPGCGAPPTPGPFEAPRTDAVPRVGSAATFDIATWNIENFPATADTPLWVADLVASMDLDLLAVQEIVDPSAFDELVSRLPGYSGVLADYAGLQKVGFVYRSNLVRLSEPALLFESEGFAFPRAPLQVRISVDDCEHPPLDLIAITLHLKAGRDADDADRRRAANRLLEQHVRDLVIRVDDEVLLLGDFNEKLDTQSGRNVMAPWISNPNLYDIQTQSVVDAQGYTFVPGRIVFDHLVTTVGLDEEVGASTAEVAQLDLQFASYLEVVSDHVPAVLRLPLFE